MTWKNVTIKSSTSIIFNIHTTVSISATYKYSYVEISNNSLLSFSEIHEPTTSDQGSITIEWMTLAYNDQLDWQQRGCPVTISEWFVYKNILLAQDVAEVQGIVFDDVILIRSNISDNILVINPNYSQLLGQNWFAFFVAFSNLCLYNSYFGSNVLNDERTYSMNGAEYLDQWNLIAANTMDCESLWQQYSDLYTVNPNLHLDMHPNVLENNKQWNSILSMLSTTIMLRYYHFANNTHGLNTMCKTCSLIQIFNPQVMLQNQQIFLNSTLVKLTLGDIFIDWPTTNRSKFFFFCLFHVRVLHVVYCLNDDCEGKHITNSTLSSDYYIPCLDINCKYNRSIVVNTTYYRSVSWINVTNSSVVPTVIASGGPSSVRILDVTLYNIDGVQVTGTDPSLFPGANPYITLTILDIYGGNVDSTFWNVSFGSLQIFSYDWLVVSTQIFHNATERGYVSATLITSNLMVIDDIQNTPQLSITVYEQYQQKAMPNNYGLIVADMFEFTLKTCPQGYGTFDGLQCSPCVPGTFNLLSRTSTTCESCPKKGIRCEGGNRVLIEQNYWADRSVSLKAVECPIEYCCQQTTCTYSDKSSLCESNRNETVPLCGACNDGFSDTIGAGMGCAKCIGVNWLVFIIPIFPCVAFVIWILRTTPSLTQYQRGVFVSTMDSDRAKGTMAVIDPWWLFWNPFLLKSVCYFYQSTTVFLNRSLISAYGTMLSVLRGSLVNSSGTNHDVGYCVFDGMNSLQQSYIPLFVIALLVLILTCFRALPKWWYFRLLCFNNCKACDIDPSIPNDGHDNDNDNDNDNDEHEDNGNNGLSTTNQSPLMEKWLIDLNHGRDSRYSGIEYFRRENLKAAFVMLFLFGLNASMWSLITVLSCRNILDYGWIHSFAGSETCFGWNWWLAFSIFFCLCLALIVSFVLLYRQNDTDRMMSPFCYYFKKETWYWEFLLILQRFFIILITQASPWSRFTNLCLILMISQLVLIAQLLFKPFLHSSVHFWHGFFSILLHVLLIISVAFNQNSLNQHKTVILVSILMAIPFSSIAIEAFRYRGCCRFNLRTRSTFFYPSVQGKHVVVWDAKHRSNSDDRL
ncbi:hypothetical protein RFI_05234 [Reticulomyxa filosa]|uniref:Uncharacterized protein n=1 Tax=Reticulomyxa filosa TaxID=46433 RepID=X6P1A0_RETFI|nr:hypothetical protein RFI_05234 [Reticulomyxa filosa]|eukprot:ETO31883.1 hypothetical protein RFI_05234 [Reticulomyxa filosa]